MQLASRNPILRTGCCWWGIFFCKAYWATRSKTHFDFRPLLRKAFAELSRKYPYPQGAHQRKRKHQGCWRLALERPHFWKLGCCMWSLFLELQKATLGSTSGRCKGVLQDHAIWLWRSLTFGSLASTYEGKCAVPFWCRTPRRQEVVALNKL